MYYNIEQLRRFASLEFRSGKEKAGAEWLIPSLRSFLIQSAGDGQAVPPDSLPDDLHAKEGALTWHGYYHYDDMSACNGNEDKVTGAPGAERRMIKGRYF